MRCPEFFLQCMVILFHIHIYIYIISMNLIEYIIYRNSKTWFFFHVICWFFSRNLLVCFDPQSKTFKFKKKSFDQTKTDNQFYENISLGTTVLFSLTAISSVEPVNCWPSEFWLKFSYCWFELPSVLFIICTFFSSWFYYFPLFLGDRNSEDPLINKLSKDMGIQINLIDEPLESKLPEHSIYIRTVSS